VGGHDDARASGDHGVALDDLDVAVGQLGGDEEAAAREIARRARPRPRDLPATGEVGDTPMSKDHDVALAHGHEGADLRRLDRRQERLHQDVRLAVDLGGAHQPVGHLVLRVQHARQDAGHPVVAGQQAEGEVVGVPSGHGHRHRRPLDAGLVEDVDVGGAAVEDDQPCSAKSRSVTSLSTSMTTGLVARGDEARDEVRPHVPGPRHHDVHQPSSSMPRSAISPSMRLISSAAPSSERMPAVVASWIALFSTVSRRRRTLRA
jgi:hypothetical protein